MRHRSWLGACPWALACGALACGALACGSHEKPEVVCTVMAPTACPDPAPTYADVVPIFEQRCASCHSGEAGQPWPLKDYQHISDWQDAVRGEVLTCAMPPADSGVAITDAERLLILTWIRCGLPK